MDSQIMIDFYNSHVPEVILMLIGLMALGIIYQYKKDDESMTYRFCLFIGVIVGLVAMFISVSNYAKWDILTAIIIALMGFTMFIRPFKDFNFAALLALAVAIIVYMLLGNYVAEYEFLADTTIRVVISLVAAGIVYSICHFMQALVQMIGKVFNWTPLMGILAIVCIAECVCLLVCGSSLNQIIAAYMTE